MADLRESVQELNPEERVHLRRWLDRVIRADKKVARRQRRQGESPGRAALWTFAGLVLFFGVDAALFHSGFYNKYLEPESSAGELEERLVWLRRSHVTEVAVVGDSRIAEGLSVKEAATGAGNSLHFFSFGMPGSTERVWYYALRDADPQRNKFRAIVIALGQYSDQDLIDSAANRLSDLNYLVGRLRYSDCHDFSLSFEWKNLQRQVATACLVRAVGFRPDLQAFLSAPAERLPHAKDWREHGRDYVDGYGGKPETLAGLTADVSAQKIQFPKGLKAIQVKTIRSTVLPVEAPQTGELTKYRTRWLGAILDLYKNSATPIVFVQLPRAPLPVPLAETPPRFLNTVEHRARVHVVPVETFMQLERPELFADGLHLNKAGRPLFSQLLGARVAEALR